MCCPMTATIQASHLAHRATFSAPVAAHGLERRLSVLVGRDLNLAATVVRSRARTMQYARRDAAAARVQDFPL